MTVQRGSPLGTIMEGRSSADSVQRKYALLCSMLQECDRHISPAVHDSPLICFVSKDSNLEADMIAFSLQRSSVIGCQFAHMAEAPSSLYL
jgi:hypothetical protein